MVVHARPLKKMKRRVTADFHDFFTFPSIAIESAGGSISDNGPFRTNVRVFLNKHALLPPPSSLFPHLLTWQILFRVGDAPTEASDSSLAGVCLDIIEEDVARSRSVYCDQCRVVGWSAHPVCTKRYHFIIKADGNSIGGYHKPCMCCGDILHLSESKCKSCNLQASTDDAEDWLYNQLENTSHVLHGVVHSNGYGHLLRVNGREGGSRVLSGCHIMDFWDRLCKVLGVRKVSVMDVSKKYGLEYRLLHSVTKGHPWYGDWGYEFGAGSFALTLDAYKRAVESLSSVPLSVFLCLRQNHSSHLAGVISYYQSLSESELVNIRDLFCFLLKLIRNAHNSPSKVCDATCNKRHVCNSGDLCPWAKSDIDRVEEAMLRVLRAVSGDTWVSIRALRGAVCKVGPPELLDYCLKELGGKIAADGMFVNATCNRDTGAIEYRLEPRSTESSIGTTPSGVLIVQDLRYLFESMLHPHTVVSYVPKETRDIAITSAEKLLDCKQFVKDYKLVKMSVNNNPLMCLPCRVELLDESDEHAMNPPPELLTLNSNATLSDLELEASRAFQDVYLMFKRFQVEDVVGFSGVDKSTQVKQLIGSAEYIRVRGRTNAKNGLSRFRMERGVERWTVDCKCGAKDDDGERMLACDVCSVWQHTRCSGIHDSETAPARFVCHRCRNPLTRAKSGVLCKESEVVTDVGSDSSFGGKSLAAYSNVR